MSRQKAQKLDKNRTPGKPSQLQAAKKNSQSSNSTPQPAAQKDAQSAKSGVLAKGGELLKGGLKAGASAAGEYAVLQAAVKKDEQRETKFKNLEANYQKQALQKYKERLGDQQLAKAMLIPRQGEKASPIEFMFNPKDFNIMHKVQLESMAGARTERGLPKINYGFVEPRTINIQGAIFDTYETGGSVLDSIKSLLDAFDFSKFSDPFKEQGGYQERTTKADLKNTAANAAIQKVTGVDAMGIDEYGSEKLSDQSLELRRPPVYYFIWGEKNYMCCMIETSNCKLMMFLPDGTPVRASVDLALREVDLGVASRKFSKRQKFTTSGG